MKLNSTTYEALSLQTVLAFDVETTGLDAAQDEILEIGIVRMENGELSDRFEQLCKPTVPIPRFVTQLTGIQQSDCENQPSMNDIIPDVREFLKEGWIVAHNASFDIGFLSSAFKRYRPDMPPVSPDRILDTLDLSRLLLPWLPNHRLGTIVEFLEIPVSPNHRALADAEATILIFKSMIPLVLALDPETIDSILLILSGVPSGLRLFFTHVRAFLKSIPSGKKKKYLKGPVNVLGIENQGRKDRTGFSFDPGEINAFFAPNGSLSRSLPGYESRKPQTEMAHAIAKAFQRDEVLAAEAGTGVGKSLAYLVPAILWSTHEKGGKTVVSTQTKTLQDQLFSKELPLLLKTMDREFLAVLLKGRANYICRRRWMDVLHHAVDRLNPEKKRQLLPLLVWMEETRTGDVEENAGFKRERMSDLWSEINCDAGQCLGTGCEFDQDCFYQNVRRTSRKADLVLINHSLLFSDLASDNSVLGEYESLVIDEAHQVERTAARCLGRTLQKGYFRKLCQRLYNKGSYESGLLVIIAQTFHKMKKRDQGTEDLLASLSLLIDTVHDLREKSAELFSRMEERVTQELKNPRANWKIRIRKPADFFGPLTLETEAVESAMQGLIFHLSRITATLCEQETLADMLPEEFHKELEYTLMQADGLRSVLHEFIHGDYVDEVVWCEMMAYQKEKNVVLNSSPLHIGAILAESLYPRVKRVLMTSATLTVGQRFDYILNRLGLDVLEQDRIVTHAFGSPFDFTAQARFLIPAYLSSPKSHTFTREVAELLGHVLSIHTRGTMVLFTSHQMLREVYRNLQPVLANTGIRLLGQGIDGARSSLLKIFQEEEQSVLLGTNSFWEGVDVPGSALELLVITRIPFDVPSEPWIEANIEHTEQTVGNGFMQYSVPEAVVRFRQGFGRLIRSREDRGAVLFLDNRSVYSKYGSLFLQSLPVEARICQDEETILDELEQWFQNVPV